MSTPQRSGVRVSAVANMGLGPRGAGRANPFSVCSRQPHGDSVLGRKLAAKLQHFPEPPKFFFLIFYKQNITIDYQFVNLDLAPFPPLLFITCRMPERRPNGGRKTAETGATPMGRIGSMSRGVPSPPACPSARRVAAAARRQK